MLPRTRVSIAITSLLVVTTATGALSAVPVRASTYPHCQAKNLKAAASLDDVPKNDGPFGAKIYLYNQTSILCTLTGYPGASAWNGRTVGNPAKWVPAAKPVIILGPANTSNDAAVAQFNNLGVGRYPKAECKPITVYQLRVFVPNSQAGEGQPKLIGFNFRTCTTTKFFNLRVRPFQHFQG